MKKAKKVLVFFLILSVMTVSGLFGTSAVTVSAEAAANGQTAASEEAGSETVEYQGLAEAPGIIKFIFVSMIGAAALFIFAIIYCAVVPMKRKTGGRR